ncbi:hypothetical protein TrRE_jg5978 [Triparma retinervis]|uniref:FAD/NAD(P)-binding domain-containing protein n=1 Tax=Triparma retinervis TaxID=2557542 RepID=A0A9W7FAG1_9STRA|nr:hypothetical protein TrRE_jg5978 [Triparma retinervis]
MSPLPSPGSPSLPFNTLIVGGGPCSCAVIVKAARLGVLSDLLSGKVGPFVATAEAEATEGEDEKKGPDEGGGSRPGLGGVCVVDPCRLKEFGRGKLGDYVISSNTNADAFVTVVTKEKSDGHPSEGALGTVLSPLLAVGTGQDLLAVGEKIAPLVKIGDWLSDIGAVVRMTLEGSKKSKLCLGCKVVSAHQRRDQARGCLVWDVRIRCERVYGRGEDLPKAVGEEMVLCAKNLVMATGGKQKLPTGVFEGKKVNSKVMLSDYVLTTAGALDLKSRLDVARSKKGGACKVAIIGGSHSAFSVAWVCLNHLKVDSSVSASGSDSAADQEVRRVKYPWGPGGVVMLHRSPVKVFYNTLKDAKAAGYAVPEGAANKLGQVNVFTGLRGDAKALHKRIKEGKESRVKMYRVAENAGGQAVRERAVSEADVVVWCAGYGTNEVEDDGAT